MVARSCLVFLLADFARSFDKFRRRRRRRRMLSTDSASGIDAHQSPADRLHQSIDCFQSRAAAQKQLTSFRFVCVLHCVIVTAVVVAVVAANQWTSFYFNAAPTTTTTWSRKCIIQTRTGDNANATAGIGFVVGRLPPASSRVESRALAALAEILRNVSKSLVAANNICY